MSSVSGSSFPLTGSLGLSIVSIAGGSGNASANAATIAASANPSTGSTPFSILASNQSTTTSSPTIAALTTGQLTNGQHKIIQAIGQSQNDQDQIPWNANGTEPSQITSLKSLGWIKLVKPIQGPKGVAAGVYSLTPVGQAIFKRTVGGSIGVPPASSDGSTPDLASVTSSLSSGISAVAGLLSQVGVNVSV